MKAADSDIRINAYVSMVHSGLDYEFFALLTSRIEAAESAEKEKLEALREKLLAMTKKIDEMLRAQMEESRKAVDAIISAPNIEEAVIKNAGAINELFLDALQNELEQARQAGDLERGAKLNQVAEIIQKLSTPPEMEIIEKLLGVETEEERAQLLNSNPDMVTPELVQMLGAFAAQTESDESQPAEVKEQIQAVFSTVMRYAMKNQIVK